MLTATTRYPYFLNSSMSSKWYLSFLKESIIGGNGAIGNLRGKDLSAVHIYIPCENEQEKIGNFFKMLYKNIALTQRMFPLTSHITHFFIITP